MAEFLSVVLAFPTLPYSVVLAFAVIYWLLVSVGLLDDDGLSSADSLDSTGHDGVSGLSAMFARLGLGGAPTMMVVLLLAFFAWTGTYFVHLFFLQHLSAGLRWLLGAVTAAAALVPAVVITSWVLRPIRRLLLRLRPPSQKSVLGLTGIVASPQVTDAQGYANVDDGGAGLVLQVRCAPGTALPRGTRIHLIDYHAATNHYLVVADEPTARLHAPSPIAAADKENPQ